MAGAQFPQLRECDQTFGTPFRAARGKGATGDHLSRRGEGAGNNLERLTRSSLLGERSQEECRVGVKRLLKEIGGGGIFHETPGIHHRSMGGMLRHDPQVVGDENEPHLLLLTESMDEVQNLRLNGHIQGGGRLVGDEQAGTARQCHGNHHPLAHPSGELVGVIVIALFRGRDADLPEEFRRLAPGPMPIHPAMEHDPLGHLIPHPENRVEGGHRFLEDHGDPVPPHGAHPLLGQPEKISPLEEDPPGDDPAGKGDQPEDGKGGNALAASRLPHDGQGFGDLKREGQIVHRNDRPGIALELGGQILDGKKGDHVADNL